LASKAHSLSSGIGIVDAPIEALGVEDVRVRNADRCHDAQMEMSASLRVGLLWRKYLLRWPGSSIGGTKPQS
jgi:hypothetical protein